MEEFTGKYIGGIIIENEEDIEKLKTTNLGKSLTEEELKASIGRGFAFDIDYLEMFWISSDRKDILDAGLQLVIQKNPNYNE